MRGFLAAAIALALVAPIAHGQEGDAAFVEFRAEQALAITDVAVVDGTGAPARAGQTVLVEQGRIRAVGPADTVRVPDGARRVDGRGKTVIPGLVLVHEHMFYPVGKRNYTEMLHSFPRLYLAGGTTTLRTAGSMAPYADLNLRREVEAGRVPGPDMDVTAPYLNGPGLPILKVHALEGPEEAERMAAYWADTGVTSYKAYMHISRAALARVIEVAHRRGHKVTGHLCSVTYREAADLGIDNLEHGFAVATDFVPGKQPDTCPSPAETLKALAALDTGSPAVRELIELLVRRNVALTSTLTVFESYTPGRPKVGDRALSVLTPPVRELYERGWERVQAQPDKSWVAAFANAMRLERMFVEAGGTLLVGTDPTGYGGVIAGFASKRALQLLVEAGFTPEQAVHMATLAGARFLGRDGEVGSLEPGKRADLVLLDGDPTRDPGAFERMPLVVKAGVGYRPDAIIDQMRGVVGLH